MVEVETNSGAFCLENVDDPLKVLTAPNKSSIIQVGDIEKQNWAFFFHLGEQGKEDKCKQTHKRYMASGTRCPICHIFKFAVAVDGAADLETRSKEAEKWRKLPCVES